MNTLCTLPDYGFLMIAGQDTMKFLQSQLTCDLTLLQPGCSLWGSHCNPQGRMISLFRLFSYQNNILLRMPKTLLPIAEEHLKKYSVFFKVTLTSPKLQAIGFSGEKETVLIHDDILVVRVPGIPPRFELLGQEEQMNQIYKKLLDDACEIPAENWKYQDLGFMLPNLYRETSGHFIPQMFYLDKLGGVSFNKGCYTGQEIIARTHYRGTLKRYLQLVELPTSIPFKPGDLFQFQECSKNQGTVIDSAVANGKSRLLVVGF